MFDIKNEYLINGDVTTVYIKTRKGKLLGEVLIDTEDLPKISEIKNSWYIKYHRKGYIYCRIAGKNFYMHRWIFGDTDLLIDHINGNTFDNRRSNLRAVTSSQNLQNRGLRKSDETHSAIPGVYYSKTIDRWVVRLTLNWKPKHFGFFINKEDAEQKAIEARRIHFPYSREARSELDNIV